MSLSNVSELALWSLVYVSRSTLSVDGDAEEIDRIVDVAVARNAQLRVTGALLYTQLHFAQVLEGPADVIENLMTSIARDRRHCDVKVVAHGPAASRRFSDWAMAYAGPFPYLDRQIKPLMSPGTSTEEGLSLAHGLVINLQRLNADRRSTCRG